MKKDKNISKGHNLAFAKVKSFFSIQRTASKSRAYDHLKLPRILGAKQKLLQQGKKEWSKREIACTQISHCSLSPKYLMHLLLELKSLDKVRSVKKLYLKEHLLAKQRFQNMGLKMNEWMTSYLSRNIKKLPEDEPQERSDIPWEDYIKHKEERQFLITRVIKYLLH